MNILHLNGSDIEGGAARAAYRLHQGLRTLGLNSRMLVRAKLSADQRVIQENSLLTKLGPRMNSVPLRRYRHRPRTLFSAQWFPDVMAARVKEMNPQIVHLHWICNGFLRLETLAQLEVPLVWTIHDLWPMTGGCHYPNSCDRYTQACGQCPQLASSQQRDLSHRIWKRKARVWKTLDLTLVAPSRWVADCLRASALFRNTRVEVISHGLNTDQFRPIDQAVARDLLGLPQNRRIILFGASSGVLNDPRKGFQFLREALEKLAQTELGKRSAVAIFGISTPDPPLDLNLPTHYLGRLSDDLTLALTYAAADVMVVPSTQETFGQTAAEAIACGTPVVAFNATGLKDVVNHQEDGYLATAFDSADLAKGIQWVLADEARYQQLRHQARQNALQVFTLERQARQHTTLYADLLSSETKQNEYSRLSNL